MVTAGQGKLGKKFKHVTLHEVSGNKVNARTRHVLTRSHANGMTRLPADIHIKAVDFRKLVVAIVHV